MEELVEFYRRKLWYREMQLVMDMRGYEQRKKAEIVTRIPL